MGEGWGSLVRELYGNAWFIDAYATGVGGVATGARTMEMVGL